MCAFAHRVNTLYKFKFFNDPGLLFSPHWGILAVMLSTGHRLCSAVILSTLKKTNGSEINGIP